MVFIKVLALALMASVIALDDVRVSDIRSCIRILEDYVKVSPQETDPKIFCNGKPNGNYSVPTNPKMIITCMTLNETCPTGLLFDDEEEICKSPRDVSCNVIEEMPVKEFCTNKESGVYPIKECKSYIRCVREIISCETPLVFDEINNKWDLSSKVDVTRKFRTEDYGTVCYGAQDKTFGKIRMRSTGRLVSMRLKHMTGYLTCNKWRSEFRSNWGCNTGASDGMTMATVITTSDDHVILPKPGATPHNEQWFYKLLPYNPNSPVITLSYRSRGVEVKRGEVLKIYYGEDWSHHTTGDNEGTHCVRVTAKFEKNPEIEAVERKNEFY